MAVLNFLFVLIIDKMIVLARHHIQCEDGVYQSTDRQMTISVINVKGYGYLIEYNDSVYSVRKFSNHTTTISADNSISNTTSSLQDVKFISSTQIAIKYDKISSTYLHYIHKYHFCDGNNDSQLYYGNWIFYDYVLETNNTLVNNCPEHINRSHATGTFDDIKGAHREYRGSNGCVIMSLDLSLRRFSLLVYHSQHAIVPISTGEHGPTAKPASEAYGTHLNLKQLEGHWHPKLGVLFVGDSLSIQLYDSFSCFIESSADRYIRNGFEAQLMHSHKENIGGDAYLRGDLPCVKACKQDHIYNSVKNWKYRCFACDESRNKKTFTNSNITSEIFPFITKIPQNTRLMVIGSGAWYNKFYGIDNSTADYIEMLSLLGPVLRDVMISQEVMIFWQELPPMIIDIKPGQRVFEWREFSKKNKLARELLSGFGVNILQTEAVLRKRKRVDHGNISYDSLHWSNLGRASIPTFMLGLIVQAASDRMMRYSVISNH